MKINFVIGLVISVAVGLRAESLRVVSSGPEEVELEWVLESVQVVESILDGQRFDDLAGVGEVRLMQAGQPALPYVAELLAAPAGAQVHLEVQPLHYRDFRDVFFVPAAHNNADEPDVPMYAPGPEYGENAFFPAQQATVEAVGILRGVEAYALHVYPYSYNPVQRVLRVFDRMEIRVRFTGGRAKVGGVGEDPHGGVFHQAFINPLHAVPRRRGSAKRAAADWYDPTAPWVKIFVEQDGLQQLDVEALDRLVDTAEIDPHTLRVIHQGQEQLVRVTGTVDGRFNGEDYLLFPGFSRRDSKGFESPFGRRNTYWLTWGGAPGLRLEERSGAPVNDYPAQRSFWTTAHFEQDIQHDPLGLLDLAYGTLFTGGNSRDHWFWDRPIKTGDVLGSGLFFGDLENPDTRQDYTARLRVALHGATGWGHHTMVQLNNRVSDDRIIDESFWEGQSELLFESEISPTWLKSGRNRLLLKVFADQEPGVDWIYFNWFEIDYLRLYQAHSSFLTFAQPPSDGHRITITGFSHADIEIFDVLNGIRFTEVEIDSVGDQFAATFEDRLGRPTLYAAGDKSSAKTPLLQLDRASALRRVDREVDYLILTHRRFLNPARTLADHRREAGLAVEVVEVQDIYDEFSHGLLDSDALRDFVDYAYHNWRRPPAYLLLLGDATFDYRNILGGSETSFVPSQYYHARERGRSPSDYFYALVDGDDLLADLAVGRLPVENTRQARDAVEKIMRYDQDPEPGDWRSRVLYLANYHEKNIFTAPSDSLGARYTEPLGLSSVKVYNPDESGIPNATGKEFIDALNNGALLVNYSGHGSVGTMQPIFSLVAEDWDYFSQVRNGARLPLVLAFSCLNSLFTHQKDNLLSLGEAFTRKADGGAIAYISATSKSFLAQNDLLGDRLFNQFFKQDQLQLGPSLNAAKSQVLAAHFSWLTVVLTMQLFGDPAQQLALPRAADYTPQSLDVGSGPVFGHSTLTVAATLKNSTRLTEDSLTVALLGYAGTSAQPETLFYATRGAFAGVVDFSFTWPVRDRRGAYRLELVLDPENRVMELYENNNDLQLDLEILEPLVPTAIFPAANAVLPARDVALEAAVPVDDAALTCQFALATNAAFDPEHTHLSPLIAAVDGIVRYRPAVAEGEDDYFWKVRLLNDATAGPWTPVHSFSLTAFAAPPIWRQRGGQLLLGEVRDLALADGRLALADSRLPFRPSGETREDAFTVRNLDGAGVLATDGTYIYTKRWYNDASTIYPGSDYFARVGTGLNGSVRQRNYGVLTDSTTAGISATYHSDGYIYNDSGRAFELERVSTATGVLDTVQVEAGLLEWQSGEVVDGHSLFTSDGQHIYNVAMSAYGQTRNEWLVRVFDPAADWAVLREFTSPPTDNGFTFKWTDGVLADGEYLYFIEWQGEHRIRMVDAFDGRLLDEWISDQDVTRGITGQYDWINNKVWLGDLLGSIIARYPRLGRPQEGQVVSAALGPAARWQRLQVRGSGDLSVDVQVEQADSVWTAHPSYTGLGPDQVVDLGAIDAVGRRIRLRAQVRDDATLEAWEVDFEPLPSLQLAAAEARENETGLEVQIQVRNLSPAASDSLRLRLERSDWDESWRDISLAPLDRGALHRVVFDSLEVPPKGVRLFVEVLGAQPDAQPRDNRREVLLLFRDRTPLALVLWPSERPFLSGDPLKRGEGLLIHAPGVRDGRIVLRVDGTETRADSTIDAPDGNQRQLYRLDVEPGAHEVEVQLVRDGEEIGFQRLRFHFADDLAIANALIYPHPVQGATAFTYVLSHPAAVAVEVYSLSGRLVRRLEERGQSAGFQQVAWDGRDRDGRPLANGTYLYRILAQTGEGEAVFRGPLSVLR